MKINNKKTFSLFLTVLLAFSVNSYSQTMSDEAIVQYVTSALAAGRTTSQIGQELISRGCLNSPDQSSARLCFKGRPCPFGTAESGDEERPA